MLDYLHSAGYHKTFEQFKEEAEQVRPAGYMLTWHPQVSLLASQSEYDPDPNSKTSDLLVNSVRLRVTFTHDVIS